MSKCYFCKGKTKIKNVDVDFRFGGKLFVVTNVPVEVCVQCGERYYSAQISKELDDLVKQQNPSKTRPQRTIQVPIFNWQ